MGAVPSPTREYYVPPRHNTGHDICKDAPVVQGKPRTVGVEGTDHGGDYPVLMCPGHAHGLSDPLPLRITGAQLHRIEIAVAILGDRLAVIARDAIDLAAAHEEEALAPVTDGVIEELRGADGVRGEDPDRIAPINPRTRRTRTVDEEIGARERRRQRGGDILFHHGQRGMRELCRQPRQEPLSRTRDGDDTQAEGVMIPRVQERLDQIGREEPSATGDHDGTPREALPRECGRGDPLEIGPDDRMLPRGGGDRGHDATTPARSHARAARAPRDRARHHSSARRPDGRRPPTPPWRRAVRVDAPREASRRGGYRPHARGRG